MLYWSLISNGVANPICLFAPQAVFREYFFDRIFVLGSVSRTKKNSNLTVFLFACIHLILLQIPEYVSVQLRGEYQSFRTETCVLIMGHACIKFFYRHELLQQYRYYWRVEPGVKYFCDMDYDPFEMFEKENKVYGKLFYLQDLMPNHYIIRVLTTPINLSTTFFRILWQRDIFYWLLTFPFCNVTFRIYNLSIWMAADNSNTMGHSKGIHERSSRTCCTG